MDEDGIEVMMRAGSLAGKLTRALSLRHKTKTQRVLVSLSAAS